MRILPTKHINATAYERGLGKKEKIISCVCLVEEGLEEECCLGGRGCKENVVCLVEEFLNSNFKPYFKSPPYGSLSVLADLLLASVWLPPHWSL